MLGLCYKRLQVVVARSCCTIPAVDYPNHFRCFQKGPVFSSSFSSKPLVQGEAQTHEKAHFFTVSYLINSFGLSPELALSVSKKQHWIRFNSPEKPNSVVKLFKDYGLSDADISKIVKKRLDVLLCHSEKILLPKLEFFSSIGISGNVLARMLCSVPTILTFSLERSLKPCYDISTTLGIPKEKLPCFFSLFCFRMNLQKLNNVSRNVSVLRAHGVPESLIQLWEPRYVVALSFESDKVKENVNKVVSMGFYPRSPTFMKALYVISVTDASKWKKKVEFFKKWGWTEDDVLLAFRRSPLFISYNEKSTSIKLDFVLNKMGYQSADVARCSDVLSYSLEKRIRPRCSVIRILLLKGLVRKELCALSSIVIPSDKLFLDRFLIKYQEQVPELFSIFQGKMTLSELGYDLKQ